MAIVKVIKDGPTTSYIHDDYCKDITPEEVKVILDRISKSVYPRLKADMEKKQREEAG